MSSTTPDGTTSCSCLAECSRSSGNSSSRRAGVSRATTAAASYGSGTRWWRRAQDWRAVTLHHRLASTSREIRDLARSVALVAVARLRRRLCLPPAVSGQRLSDVNLVAREPAPGVTTHVPSGVPGTGLLSQAWRGCSRAKDTSIGRDGAAPAARPQQRTPLSGRPLSETSGAPIA